MEKDVIKYMTTIDNRFWESLLRGLKPGHVYSYPEALASIIQRAYSSKILMGDEWFEVSASVLAVQFGWYRLKTKKFIDFCVEIGILETRQTGKQRLARCVVLKIKNAIDANHSSQAVVHPTDDTALPPSRFNFSDKP